MKNRAVCFQTQNQKRKFSTSLSSLVEDSPSYISSKLTQETPLNQPISSRNRGKSIENSLRVYQQSMVYRSHAHWEFVLSSEVKLSERFESIKRTIYAIGFTCLVVMGIEKFSKEVCWTYFDPHISQDVAIKVILKSKLHSEDEVERALHEMKLHPQLIHKNIIPCIASEETRDSIIIITPLAKGDLHSFAVNKVVGEENCRRLCKQVLEGLQYLHGMNLVHCDIKPENILLFESAGGKYFAKICDFGFTERIDGSGLLPYRGMRGSLGYFSPEQLQKKAYGQPVDIFALGIIIYTLLCGYEPFYPTNRAGLLTGDPATDSQILSFQSPYWDHISTAARDFLRGVLHGDPAKRLTASLALESDWIRIPSKSDNVLAQELAEDAHIQFE